MRWLQFVLWQLENPGPWNRNRIFNDIKALSLYMNLKVGEGMRRFLLL